MTDKAIQIDGFVITRTVCGAGKDGDCICEDCPQLRDNEPYHTQQVEAALCLILMMI